MPRIQVRKRDTGQVGTIEDWDFDPNLFERIGEPAPTTTPQTAAQQGFIERWNLLPVAGGMLGFIGGGGPLGLGVGAGLGETLEQILFRRPRGEPINPLAIAGEAALAGIGAPILGKGLGYLGRGLGAVATGAGRVTQPLLSRILPALSQLMPEERVLPALAQLTPKERLGQLGLVLPTGLARRVPPVERALPALTQLMPEERVLPALAQAMPEERVGGLLGGLRQRLAAFGYQPLKSASLKASESGVNLMGTIQKWMPRLGANLDEAIGVPEQRGLGGRLGALMSQAEDVIQTGIAGYKDRFAIGELTSALQGQSRLLSRLPGNEAKIGTLQKIIVDLTKKYPKGFSAGQLLSLKRAADSKFGVGVVSEQVGAAITSAQKVLANTARGLLHQAIPEVSQALSQEQELILLREVLKRTAAGVATEGLPTSLSQFLGMVGRGPARAITTMGAPTGISPTITGALGQVGVRLPFLFGEQAPTALPTPTPEEVSTISPMQQVAPQLAQGLQITPEMVALGHLMLPPREAKKLAAAYEMIAPQRKVTDRSVSLSVGETEVNRVIGLPLTKGYGPATGKMYEFQMRQLGGMGVPREIAELHATYEMLRQNVVRSLQGARMSDIDIELASGYIPRLSDTQQTAEAKLSMLQRVLQDMRMRLESGTYPEYGPTQQSPDFGQLFQQLGL